MTTIELNIDLPEGMLITGYERIEDGHAFQIDWTLDPSFCCQRCRRQEPTRIEYADKIHVIRDLDIWNQPSFFVYQPPYHRCSYCNRRQWLLPPCKRPHVTYTYRFEQWVLQLLIGSSEEEVARRVGISAEMVATIVSHQVQEEQQIDPERVITDVGIDEISLKKRHRLYATILTDLTDPERPQVLAVQAGKDQAAAAKCLEQLSEQQRQQVRTHRLDMSAAYLAACKDLLPNSRAVIDRFHVAQKLGEAVDKVRKKKTRAFKKRLSVKERKQFRSCLWAFRRRPEDLSESEQKELEQLFKQLPELQKVYWLRWGITEVFDEVTDVEEARQWLEEYRALLDEEDTELLAFFASYDAHREGILEYFVAGQSSGVVEGLNNKARVITKRCYGVKSTKTLWQRLCLDVNLAARAVGRTVKRMKEIVGRIRATFLGFYT